MRTSEIFRKAWHETKPFLRMGWKLYVTMCLSLIAVPLGFWAQCDFKSMTRLGIGFLYGLGSLFAVVGLVFLWNLWLAPYRLIDERGKPGPAPESADPSAWRNVPELKIWEAADICAGISPTDSAKRMNDRSRALLAQLIGAVEDGTLHPVVHDGAWGVKHYRVKREELKRYFTELGEVPEFLR